MICVGVFFSIKKYYSCIVTFLKIFLLKIMRTISCFRRLKFFINTFKIYRR